MDWIDWPRLEARIPLDELPAFHRAFLETVRPGENDWSAAFLRQVQGKVQASLKQLERSGRAKREGDTLLVDRSVVPKAFLHYAGAWAEFEPISKFIVNVEGVVRRGETYLLTVRSEHEAHAPGTLSLPGGKVELSDVEHDTLEHTLRREIMEEVGVEVGNPVYLESKWFRADDGEPVVDVVFLCEHIGGDAKVGDPDEVAEVLWLTAAEVVTHPKAPPWTRESVQKAERFRHNAN